MLLVESNFNTTTLLEESVNDSNKKMYIKGPFVQFGVVNRNRRIYPQDIMESAVSLFKNDYLSRNMAVGELEHPLCYTADASVLVKNKGFVPIADVQYGDIVYGHDVNTNKTIETTVTANHKYNYDGDLIRLVGRKINATVTPHHRFYLKSRYGKFDVVTAEDILNSVTTDNKLSHHHIPLVATNYEPSCELKEIIISFSNFTTIKTDYAKNDLHIDINDYAKLLGIYLAEGCVKKNKDSINRKNSTVEIGQNVGMVFYRIIELIEKIGLNYSIYYNKDKQNASRISIRDVRLAEHFAQFGNNCYEKYIPNNILNSRLDVIDDFIEWYFLGDGTTHQGEVYSQKTIFTTSKKLADGLSECLFKIGHSVNIRTQLSKKDYKFANHIIKIENKSPLYRICFGKSKGVYTDKRFLECERIKYSGNVFCISTGTSNFYVMQNNKLHLTGNSNSMQINSERIACRITEIEQDGNNYIGKALLLETPMGKIARSLIEGGVQLGVSSRAAGTVKKNRMGIDEVQKGLQIKAIDIVSTPSGISCFVEGILESYTPLWNSIEEITDANLVEDYKNSILQLPTQEINEKKIEIYQNFINILTKKV